jgi:NAD(P)-dependent dehydrogenase (short-subunit alcohol dehydrogenase family)
MEKFERKKVYITGGSSGIGLETGRLMVRLGADVVLIARNREKLEDAKRILDAARKSDRQSVSIVSMDVGNPSEVYGTLKDVVETLGAPDILVNSAGINLYADRFENITPEMFAEVMNTNVNGLRNVTHALFGPMKSKKGHVVILSSAAALFGMYGYTAYGTSKAALMGFAESLRYEFAPHGMPVTVVFPPETDTPMNLDEARTLPEAGRAMKSMGGFLTPEYVAGEIVRAIERKKYFVIPGWSTRFLYFLHRLSNGALSRAISDGVVRGALRKSLSSHAREGR